MKAKLFFITACCLLLSLPTRAEEPKAMYVPTSGWLVGPASIVPAESADTRLPCIMMNQYDNGFTFRFSGGNQRLLALAIDFRQAAFTAGEHYAVVVDIPPSFKKTTDAVAYNDAILIISAVNGPTAIDLYKAVSQGQQMRLGLGNKTLDFALLGAADGLRRVDSCYGGTGAPAEAAAAPPPGMQSSATPSANDTGSAVDAMLSKATPAPTAANPTPAGPMHQGVVNNSVDKSVDQNTAPIQWKAKKGASLQDVINGWAKTANARVVWKAARNFPVKESLGVEGSFDQAIKSLLKQYDDEKERPTGRLYKDPASGEMVLMIEQTTA